MDPLALGASLAILTTVLAVALAVQSGAATSAQIRGRLEGMLSGPPPALDSGAIDPLRQNRTVLGVLRSIISGAWLSRMERELRLAESQLQPSDLIAIRVALAGLGFAAPYLLLGGPIGLLAGLAGSLIGLQAPQIWLGRRRAARSKKLEQQLPEALTSIANSIKAGFGLSQSLSLAAEQLEHPIGTELALTIHEMSVGSSTDEAFLALSERNDSYDLDLVVTAILVQRSAGGNLAEILSTVAETMRERVRIRGEISTLTAQQSMSGVVISLLPVGVCGLFFVISPDYVTVLFTETIGQVLLGVAAVMETIGILIIKRILAIEV